jgi:F-type H+-transporting ATPase subunit epsilon
MSDQPKIKFELVTPERVVLREEITQITLPTTNGEVTILPHHIPLVAILQAGVVELKRLDGSLEVLAVSGGLVEVLEGKVVILADTAEHASELDESGIETARIKAEKLKSELTKADQMDFTAVTLMLDKELARSKALRKWRKIKNIETIN